MVNKIAHMHVLLVYEEKTCISGTSYLAFAMFYVDRFDIYAYMLVCMHGSETAARAWINSFVRYVSHPLTPCIIRIYLCIELHTGSVVRGPSRNLAYTLNYLKAENA